jgi:hypothetical protein
VDEQDRRSAFDAFDVKRAAGRQANDTWLGHAPRVRTTKQQGPQKRALLPSRRRLPYDRVWATMKQHIVLTSRAPNRGTEIRSAIPCETVRANSSPESKLIVRFPASFFARRAPRRDAKFPR